MTTACCCPWLSPTAWCFTCSFLLLLEALLCGDLARGLSLFFRGSGGAFRHASRACILGWFGTELGGVLAARDVLFFGAFGGFALWRFGSRFKLVF